MTSSLPTGTITFLFTDIEGSTRLWQQHPVAMQASLAQHHAILRQAIETHSGHVFQIVGDAFCASFARALDGFHAALTAQRALHDQPWGETGPLRVRMGLHTGEAEARDGEYLSSPTLIRTQRVMAAAHGGQTLLSAAVQELVRDQLPAGVSLKELGEHRLKDLVRPEQLFQLVATGVPSDFPPLRTLDAHSHNLPVQLSSFIGRERDLAEVKRLLRTTHLVTLTGAGGTGKTRLALQVAADLLPIFRDGVWLIELASLTDPASVAQAVASILDVHEQTGRPVLDTLSDYLRSRYVLLVLDNCEHLVDACAQLAATLLHMCSNVRILATSREAIGITGETTWYVPSLSAPHPHHLPADGDAQSLIAELTHYEAVRLFLDRAVAVQPTFTMTPQNALTVTQICHQLDGIPLAIELAAARMKALPLEQIAARLDNRFNFLTVGSRTALPRQQTLRATIDWSYDLLSDAERVLLARLSVFAGGWTLEAAEVVCKDEGRIPPGDHFAGMGAESDPQNVFQPSSLSPDHPDVLDLFTRLVDKSLVVMEGHDHAARYRMLETIRQYGSDKLLEAGEAEQVQMRHLHYFLKIAEDAEPHLRDAEQIIWLDRLETEHDNLRAAMDFALEHKQPESALRLAGTLARFWYLRGYWSEGREWLKRALSARTPAEPNERALSLARAKALYGAGWLADESGLEAELYAESLSLCRTFDNVWGAAFSLRGLGVVASNRDDFARATQLLEESLILFRELEEEWGMALVHFNRGWLAFDQYDQEQAQTLWEESLRLFQQRGDRWGIAVARGALGYIARLQSDYKRATTLSKESLKLFEELGDKAGIATSLSRLANVALRRDDFQQVTSLFEESITLQKELGYERDTAYAYSVLGLVAGYQGNFGRAHAMLDKSEDMWREIGDDVGLARALDMAALVVYYQGDEERALQLWDEGLRRLGDKPEKASMASTLIGLGRVALRRGDYQHATAVLEQSLTLGRETADKQHIANVLFMLARVAHAQGDDERAAALYRDSLNLRRDTGAKRGIAECLEGLAQIASAQNCPARSAQLYGAADALRETLGAPLPPVEREEYERSIAATRATLNAAEWTMAWKAGRDLNIEQAVAYALKHGCVA